MEKKTLEILAGLALIILLSGPTSIYALGYFDSDGDGVIDNQDPFPHDPLKSKDSDGDGVGDTADAFPYDPNEQYDSDDDGVGNNEDEFPHNPRESKDSDGDGAGDNTDVFPNDPAASKDSDHDGYPDEWNEGWNQSDSTTNLTVDAFPYDPDEQYDSDGDGVGDTADAFPHNPNNWRDPSALPSEVIFDRDIQLSEISVGKGITYGGTYYYILDYSAEDNDARRVYQFDSNFSFTGLAWDYANYIENPTGIVYHDGHIYITGNKYDLLHGLQAYICKFSTTGEYQNSTSISSYVDYVRAITCSDNHLYICDSESTEELIHIYDASTLSHVGVITINHYPSDIIVHETGNWCYINDQSLDVHHLYLYDLDGTYQNWSKQFYQKSIVLVEDTLIALSGNKISIHKLF